jgi:hypothetical protein
MRWAAAAMSGRASRSDSVRHRSRIRKGGPGRVRSGAVLKKNERVGGGDEEVSRPGGSA